MKKIQHPMHALWPYPTVNRYLNFYSLFRVKRTQLFALYEQQDGKYHGPEKMSTGPSAAAVSASAGAREGDDESEEEEFDDVDFV